ncbi:hypothetical protein D0T84_03155 [Dysgonomonas sp. 521]|uniref:hypothetical protein n=1 Tax=Dysgonomonas sp. 521 TaxID=2302932 RepID=UPI0013D262DA|nr:hypothetical protein [Dysgonomonas sp. 521]NDV93917.1 hypothetical protein [Dysgonomonas sp. 521]
MKKIYLFSFILFTTLVSCQKKEGKVLQAQLDTLSINLSGISLSSQVDSIDLTKVSRLTRKEYNDLQLFKVKGLGGYEVSDLSMGQVLFSNNNGKILTVQVITDGEITEFLLSYDKNGDLQDDLLVAYEDMVEYYSEISSKIRSKEIVVQTINYTYGGDEDNQSETSDTAFVKYQITPDFKFVMD